MSANPLYHPSLEMIVELIAERKELLARMVRLSEYNKELDKRLQKAAQERLEALQKLEAMDVKEKE